MSRSRNVTWSWTEVFSSKVSLPFPCPPLRFFEPPWLFWSPALSQREARTVQAAGKIVELFMLFFQLSILKCPCESLPLKKKKKSSQSHFLNQVFKVQGRPRSEQWHYFVGKIARRLSENGNRAVSSNSPPLLHITHFHFWLNLFWLLARREFMGSLLKVIQLLSKLWMMEKTVLDILSNEVCSG